MPRDNKDKQKIKVHDRDAINLQYRELFTGRDHGRRHREGGGVEGGGTTYPAVLRPVPRRGYKEIHNRLRQGVSSSVQKNIGGQEMSPLTLLFSLSPNYLLILLLMMMMTMMLMNDDGIIESLTLPSGN